MNQNLMKNRKMTENKQNSGIVTRPFPGQKIICAALILLCLVITAAITGIRPAAADGTGSGTEAEPWLVSTWSGLYEKLYEGGWIRLTADVTYGQGGGDHAESPLAVNAEVTLDLNGHTIDRGLKDSQADFYGYVIMVERGGNLTLKDTAGGGLITGGKPALFGGGVYDLGTFTMEGGTISGNSAADRGGGVYVERYGTFTMEGGTISGNSATTTGGGVYVAEASSINLSGSPVITGNTKEGGEEKNNVYLLNPYSNITVTGPLTGADASVGVTIADGSQPFTNTGSFNDPLKFFSDNSATAVGKDPDTQQLYLGTPVTLTYDPNGGTGTAFTQTYASGSLVTVSGNKFSGNTQGFADWNTKEDGSGTSYAPEKTLTISNNLTLYAQWAEEAAASVTHTEAGVETVMYYASLSDAVGWAADGDTVTMLKSLQFSKPLTFERSGVSVTLDLNGYTIDRHKTGAGSDGYAIKIGAGTLTLKDSSASADVPGTGLITRGKSSGYGGGVYVTGGSFILESGTISGCTAKNGGGGVYVSGGSSFTMKGGTVSANSTTDSSGRGGGVYVDDGGSFILESGTVSGCTAAVGGGVYVQGGGSFNLSGSPVITDNTTEGGAAGNVYLFSGAYITVTGPLTGADASVGVTMADGSGPFTNTGTDHLSFNDPLKFFSDNSAAAVGKDPDTKQLYLGTPVYISGISAADKIYDGTTDASLTGTAVLNYVSDDTQVPGLTVSGITAAFADRNAGNGKNVSVTGALLSNTTSLVTDLDKTNEKLGLTASITAKPVTITGVTGVTRGYEAGNLTVALTGGEVSGKVDGDDVFADLSAAAGTMADADIGTDKPVTVSGVKPGGADADNYVLSAQPSGVTVTISGDGTAPSGNAALRLPSGLKEVQASAFEGSPSFDEVYLPDGMETIGGRAFADCSGLKLVHIPDSVTSIADDAFAGSLHVIFSCTSGSIGASYARDHYIMRQNP